MRFPLIAGAFFLLGIAVETWTLAALSGRRHRAFYLVLMQCMRHLRLWRWRGRPVGAALVRAIPVICLRHDCVARRRGGRARADRAGVAARKSGAGWQSYAQLEDLPGAHLVIVRYGPDHDLDREWVYNAAILTMPRSSGPATWAPGQPGIAAIFS